MDRFALSRMASLLLLLCLLAVTVFARFHNRADVLQEDGRIYFMEGDCYSRMTRAKMVCEGQWIIRQHDFENWPQGTIPHTTAPMDWLIAVLKWGCDGVLVITGRSDSVRPGHTLDAAGALVSPILALLTAGWLWWWIGAMRLPYRGVAVLFFALSPILVHGTKLGRPDHQSLLLLLLSVAISAELALAERGLAARSALRWSLVAGLAWGFALWVSLYEPLVFFFGAMAQHVVFQRAAIVSRSVIPRWIGLSSVLAVALLVDGWRFTLPEPVMRESLTRWSQTIGELRHLNLGGVLVWHWLGVFWVAAPVTLWLASRYDRRVWGVLLLVAVMLVLTVWQVRWGYFLALAVAISLPWQLGLLRKRWAGWMVALAAMTPLAWGWSATLMLDEEERERREERRALEREYRNVAELMRAEEKRPFVAPWWASPQIAYWSGQPGVAGTSHQSIAGIVDSARVFAAEDATTVREVLLRRGVRYIVVHDLPIAGTEPRQYPAVNNAAQLLGLDGVPSKAFGWLLAETPRHAPNFLRYITPEERGLVYTLQQRKDGGMQDTTVRFWAAQYLKVFEVVAKLP